MRLGIDLGMNQRFGAAPAAPAAFTAGQWTLADSPSAGGNTLTVNLTALPSDGGSAITALQFRRNSGPATALTGTGAGSRVITVPATTAADIQVRAVNAIGAGPWSDTKTATPTVNAPATFNYELATLSQRGAGITQVRHLRFSIDNNVTWCLPGFGNCSGLSLGVGAGLKTIEVTGFASDLQLAGFLVHLGIMPNAQSPGLNELDQFFARDTDLPEPILGTGRPAGLGIRTTKPNAPVGVT